MTGVQTCALPIYASVGSAGTRGVNPDRDAKGGPNPAIVTVAVTPAEVADFKKGIA